jgi:adenylate cyclase class IV
MRQQQVQIKIRIRLINSFITVKNTFLIKPLTTNEELSFKLQKNTKCKNAPMALQTCCCFQKNKRIRKKNSNLKNKKNTPIGKITLILLMTIPLFLTQI